MPHTDISGNVCRATCLRNSTRVESALSYGIKTSYDSVSAAKPLAGIGNTIKITPGPDTGLR